MEVLNLVRLFWGWVFPYISRTYSFYRWGFLHFRYLKFLVMLWLGCCNIPNPNPPCQNWVQQKHTTTHGLMKETVGFGIGLISGVYSTVNPLFLEGWYVREGWGCFNIQKPISLSKSNCAVDVDSFFVDRFSLFIYVLFCAFCCLFLFVVFV